MLKDLVKVEELYRLKGATAEKSSQPITTTINNITVSGMTQLPEDSIIDQITEIANANANTSNTNKNQNNNNNGVNLQLKKEFQQSKVTTGSNVGKNGQMRMLGSPSSPQRIQDYMSKQFDQKSLGSTNLYVGKRSQAVNSDIEGLLAVKKKAKKIKNSIVNQSRNTRNHRQSNLMCPSPPLTNFKGQYKTMGLAAKNAGSLERRQQVDAAKKQVQLTTLELETPQHLVMGMQSSIHQKTTTTPKRVKEEIQSLLKDVASRHESSLNITGVKRSDSAVKIYDDDDEDLVKILDGKVQTNNENVTSQTPENFHYNTIDNRGQNFESIKANCLTPLQLTKSLEAGTRLQNSNEALHMGHVNNSNLRVNTEEDDDPMPIKKTNLSMFLEEARNENDLFSPSYKMQQHVSPSTQQNSAERQQRVGTRASYGHMLSGASSVQGAPLKLERLANAPMFQVKAVGQPVEGRNQSMHLPVAKFGRFKQDEKPVSKRFWEQDSVLSPISATRALIVGGLRGQQISVSQSVVHDPSSHISKRYAVQGHQHPGQKNKIRSNQTMLGQIATHIANQQQVTVADQYQKDAAAQGAQGAETASAENSSSALGDEGRRSSQMRDNSKMSKLSKKSDMVLIAAQAELAQSLQIGNKHVGARAGGRTDKSSPPNGAPTQIVVNAPGHVVNAPGHLQNSNGAVGENNLVVGVGITKEPKAKQSVFKKESSSYLSVIGIDLPDRSKSKAKKVVERLFEVNLSPEPKPKYTQMVTNVQVRLDSSATSDQNIKNYQKNNERYQNTNNNEFAETFYLEGQDAVGEDDSDYYSQTNRIATVSPKLKKIVDFNQYAENRDNNINGVNHSVLQSRESSVANSSVLMKQEYVPDQILQQLQQMIMDKAAMVKQQKSVVGQGGVQSIFIGGDKPAIATNRQELYLSKQQSLSQLVGQVNSQHNNNHQHTAQQLQVAMGHYNNQYEYQQQLNNNGRDHGKNGSPGRHQVRSPSDNGAE